MNENNVDYLVNQVKFTGFGDSLEFPIKENIAKGLDEFELSYKPDFGKDKAEATLHFRKSEQGNYFFNKYDLAVNQEKGETLVQSFSVTSSKQADKNSEGKPLTDANGDEKKEWVNNTFTLKEAFNLMDVNQKMEGRSVLKDFVNKEGEKHTFWNKLDFANRDRYNNYEVKTFMPFELEAKLSKFPIKEMETEKGKEELLNSLQKGNRQIVTMVGPNGNEEKRGLEANPQFKTVNLYEGNQKVKHQTIKQETSIVEGQAEKEVQSSGKKQTNKAKDDAADDDEPGKTQKKTSRKRQGVA